MRNLGTLSAAIIVVALSFFVGCSGKSQGGNTGGGGITAPLSITVTDTPPAGVTILSFQITITGAVLQPGNVSLLKAPQTLELTQLLTNHALLTAQNVAVATYNSLTLTFANPTITIFNAGTPITVSTQTCGTNAICTVEPPLNSASLDVSSPPFPLALSSNTPVGLLLDINLANLIQVSGLAVDPTAAGAVTITSLPSAQPTAEQDLLNAVTGQVTSVGMNQFVLKTSNGNSLTVNVNGSTKFFFPAKVCSANNFSCVVNGQILSASLSLLGNGTLQAVVVDFEDANGMQEIEGSIVSITPGAKSTSFKMIVNQMFPNLAGVTIGGEATVTIQNSTTLTTFLIDSNSFTLPGNVSFAATTDLLVGQEVLVRVEAGSAGLSINSNQVILRTSGVTATVFLINVGSANFSVNVLPSLFTSATPTSITQILAQTSSQTVFVNVNLNGLSGLATGQIVSSGGFLFNTITSTGSPTMATETVVGR